MQRDSVKMPYQVGQSSMVRFRQASQHLSQLVTSFLILVRRLDCRHETIIEGEGANGIGKLAEVHLEQGGHGVDVLHDQLAGQKIREPRIIESPPQSLSKEKFRLKAKE